MRTPKPGPSNGDGAKRSSWPRRKKNTETKNNNNKNKSSSSSSDEEEKERQCTPLSEVVVECGKRWFEDALKEAKSGDVAMQVLVSQMYFHAYGTPKDLHKANYWMTKASRVRSSVWNVSNKRPGYHASDSDSESDDNS